MIKTGITSESYCDFPDERKGLLEIREDGYDCIDYSGITAEDYPVFSLGDQDYKNYLADLGAFTKSIGLEIYQAHGLWPSDDTSAEKRSRNIELYKRQIEGCSFLGCQRLVVHPVRPFGWEKDTDHEFTFQENIKMWSSLIPTAKDFGVMICVENLPFDFADCFGSHTENIRKIIDAIDSPYVRICLDTGHANIMGENISESVLICGDKLEALHVHDNGGGSYNDRHYPPYYGNIDWDGFSKALGDIGFKGCISLEPTFPKRAPDEIKEYFRKGYSAIAKHLANKV